MKNVGPTRIERGDSVYHSEGGVTKMAKEEKTPGVFFVDCGCAWLAGEQRIQHCAMHQAGQALLEAAEVAGAAFTVAIHYCDPEAGCVEIPRKQAARIVAQINSAISAAQGG